VRASYGLVLCPSSPPAAEPCDRTPHRAQPFEGRAIHAKLGPLGGRSGGGRSVLHGRSE